jgi:hypothetical protein
MPLQSVSAELCAAFEAPRMWVGNMALLLLLLFLGGALPTTMVDAVHIVTSKATSSLLMFRRSTWCD